jgi:hypothetical protein
MKDQIRSILESEDIEHNFDEIAIDLPINPALATYEVGDGGLIKGEDFLNAMFNNWKQMNGKFETGYDRNKIDRSRKIVEKGFLIFIAVYRNDSAYFERLGGMISFLASNKDRVSKVKNLDQEHAAILENLHQWWKVNDKRLRTKLWINNAFKLLIKKYKTDMYYRRCINMCLIFIANNTDKWQDDNTFHPDNWFPKKRGKFCNAMFGGRF